MSKKQLNSKIMNIYKSLKILKNITLWCLILYREIYKISHTIV